MNQRDTLVTSPSIVLPNNEVYYYEIGVYEMKNMLGNTVAILQEYVLTKEGERSSEALMKLYKTREGSWYEIEEITSPEQLHLIRNIKIALDANEVEIMK